MATAHAQQLNADSQHNQPIRSFTLHPPRSRASLGGPPEDASLLAAELAIVSMQRSLDVNTEVVDVLRNLYIDAGPGTSRLRRKATPDDGLWSDLARPARTTR